MEVWGNISAMLDKCNVACSFDNILPCGSDTDNDGVLYYCYRDEKYKRREGV